MVKQRGDLANFWDCLQNPDSASFSKILENIPKTELFLFLQANRGKGRNDYPIAKMWDLIYQKFMFAVCETQTQDCSSSALSRFLKNLEESRKTIVQMLDRQIKILFDLFRLQDSCFLIGFQETEHRDVRYHYLLEGTYGIPLALHVGPKSHDLLSEAYFLIKELNRIFPDVDEKILIGNESYDDVSFITKLWDAFHIKPIIALKKESRVRYFSPFPQKNISFSSTGDIFCITPFSEQRQQMIYCGFERKRGTLKFKCVSEYYNIDCKNKAFCRAISGVRIPMDLDRRLFTPIPRSSYKFQVLTEKSTIDSFFCLHLNVFKEKIKMYDLRKKDLLSLLFRSFLYASAIEVLKKGSPLLKI